MRNQINVGAVNVTRAVAAAALLAVAAPAVAGSTEDEAFRQGLSAYRTNDFDRARTIWLELAERGQAKAQTALGFLYLSGLRVEQSDKQAARWFEAAAVQGDPDAQFHLGTMYLDGRGVRADAAAAHFWCELSISLGVTDALQAAHSCSEKAAQALTKEQIAATRLRVNYWHANPPPAPELKPKPSL